jgi:cyanophycin synthetase
MSRLQCSICCSHYGKPGRIPIIAITGTNGKTTTTRLIAHIYRQTGQIVGYTTTDGIYIDDHVVEKGDTTGPQSAQVILKDPTVEVAVLETARGGILRSGLAFDTCDVGVVLNVSADHLGLGDIETIEQMAQVKSVVAESVSPKGYAVLNADDPLGCGDGAAGEKSGGLFRMNPANELVKIIRAAVVWRQCMRMAIYRFSKAIGRCGLSRRCICQ